MKKILFLAFIGCIIILCVACSNTSSKNIKDGDEKLNQELIYEKSTHTSEVDLADNIGAVLDFEISEKLAVEIGNAVLKSVYNETILNNTKLILSENEKGNIFTISRVINDIYTDGGDCNVAISKTDGKILKIWMGE